MPSLKDLRNRIASVKATQKITRAMQMVAAAKLHRAQLAAEAARPYSKRIDEILSNIANSAEFNLDEAQALILGTGKTDTHLLVVATAERGLCGGFNTSIARLARDHARYLLNAGKKVKFLCIGKKGADVLKAEFGSMIIDQVDLREVKNIAYNNADIIGKKIVELFIKKEFDVSNIFYSQFKSIINQVPTMQQIIPLKNNKDSDEGSGNGLYEYEPNKSSFLEDLLPRNISVQVFKALLENSASEQGARMSAMDSATRNAGEMIEKLTISYNRQRQAQITKELIEIISGAEAL